MQKYYLKRQTTGDGRKHVSMQPIMRYKKIKKKKQKININSHK